MAKIHETEKCMICGGLVKPYTICDGIKKDIDRQIAEKQNTVLFICSANGMSDNEADVTYFFCANCCRIILNTILRSAITQRKKILSRNFNDLKKEIK